MNRAKRLFNTQMIWGAVLGFSILGGLEQIRNAWHHHGPGYVTYEQPERTERVPENQYKRHEYATGVMMVCMGLGFWMVVAKSDKKDSDRSNDENR